MTKRKATDRPQPVPEAAKVPRFKPTAQLVLFLANKLTEERAALLRLQNYVTDVLGEELPPEDLPIMGVESVDYEQYWEYTARVSLHDTEVEEWDAELFDASPESADNAEMFPIGVRADELGGAPAFGLTAKQQTEHVTRLLKLKR